MTPRWFVHNIFTLLFPMVKLLFEKAANLFNNAPIPRPPSFTPFHRIYLTRQQIHIHLVAPAAATKEVPHVASPRNLGTFVHD